MKVQDQQPQPWQQLTHLLGAFNPRPYAGRSGGAAAINRQGR